MVTWRMLEIETLFRRTTIGNGIWGIKRSRDLWRHVTLKGQVSPNTLRAQYLENSWRCCYLAIDLLVCCEAVLPAVLATAWLLVGQASVRRLSVCTECIVAKWWVIEQKLLLRAYMKSYMRNRLVQKWMTLTFVSRSFKVMPTIAASISPKLLELETSNLVCGFVWGLGTGTSQRRISKTRKLCYRKDDRAMRAT